MCNLPIYALALHTSGSELGLSLSNFAGDDRSQVWDVGRELSSRLHLYLGEFLRPLTWADLAFLAVAKGPGSFTSTRIGMVAARTLAQQLNIPLFAVSTLAAIAQTWATENLPNPPIHSNASHRWTVLAEIPNAYQIDIAVQMSTPREQVFVAFYTATWTPAISAQVPILTTQCSDSTLSRADWQHQLAQRPRPYQLLEVSSSLGREGVAVLELAHQAWQRGDRPHWSDALPFYGQSPV